MSTSNRSVLFITSPEHGQSNIALAVAGEFLHRGDFVVHIASFKQLSTRIQDFNNQTEYDRVIHFHEIAGLSITEITARKTANMAHLPGIAGTLDGCEKINNSVLGWKPEEYLLSYRSCLNILEEVRPTVVVADPLLHLGLDAARSLRMRIAILWPVPLKDVVISVQPRLGILWKYPL